MNNIMSIIGMILGGIVAGYLINILQKKFFTKAKETVIAALSDEDKTKLLDLYKKGLTTLDQLKKAGVDTVKELGIKVPEVFSGAKLLDGMTNITSKIGWAKDIQSIFSLRKLIIVGVLIGVIYGAGLYIGKISKPAVIQLKNGKEIMMDIGKGEYLHITKDGKVHVQDSPDDKTAKIHKIIKVSDIESLKKELRPYGVDIKYFACTGASMGAKSAFEAGVGVQTLKYYRWNINHLITNAGVYPIGLGYQITDNFDIVAAGGIGYKPNAIGEIDKRIGIFGKWKF